MTNQLTYDTILVDFINGCNTETNLLLTNLSLLSSDTGNLGVCFF